MFMRITAVSDRVLAALYLSIAWKAVRYLSECYKDTIFTGVGAI